MKGTRRLKGNGGLTRRFLQESQALCTRLRLRKNSLLAAKVIIVDIFGGAGCVGVRQRLEFLALSALVYQRGTCGC